MRRPTIAPSITKVAFTRLLNKLKKVEEEVKKLEHRVEYLEKSTSPHLITGL